MPSLSQSKASLFGSTPAPKTSSSGPITAASKQRETPAASQQTTPKVALFSEISVEAKTQKLEEARSLEKAGEEYLRTSLFKWSPDHLGASTKFEHASNAYKVAGDIRRAYETMEKAAKSHAAYDSFGTAATSFVNASKLAAAMPDGAGVDKAVQLLTAAADMWSLHGDVFQVAQCYLSAGEISEMWNADRTQALYLEARDLICPREASNEELRRINVRGLDAMRKIFKFFIRDNQRLSEALTHAQLMVRQLQAFEQDEAAHKILAAVTIIQLHMKDIVSADQTYISDLGVRGYASSKACEIAENLLEAMKNFDSEALAVALRSETMQYLDREVQLLAKSLTMRPGAAPSTACARSVVSAQSVDMHATALRATTEISVIGDNSGGGKVESIAIELELPPEAAAPISAGNKEEEDEDLDLC
jgi:hypothetical protein